MQLSILDRVIDKLERKPPEFSDVRHQLRQVLRRNVACYIESSMAFPATDHDHIPFILFRENFHSPSDLQQSRREFVVSCVALSK